MPNDGYFDIKQDDAIIEAGSFFCEGCLIGKPSLEASPDPRYCQGCYEFLLKEADILKESGSWKHPAWLPKSNCKPR